MNTKENEVLATIETVAIQPLAFNVINALDASELEAIERLVSVRMKPLEINTMESAYPEANAVELFIIYKMKQLAADEVIAYAWRKNQKDWKDSVLVATRNVLKSDANIRKNAEHELVELNDNIPFIHHAAIVKYVVDALDKGSQDERILQMQKIFKS
jgi:hypothetical protein